MPRLSRKRRLPKELGLGDVYAISTGAMFSSGFFLLPGLAAGQTGPSVVLAYLIAGLLILPAMLSKAELSTAMPRAGGTYYFLDRSLGPMVGTVGGIGTWFALVFKSAFALIGMGAYLAIYFNVPIQPLAVALTIGFAVLNIVGAKQTSGLQRILVAFLLAVLAFFIVQGLTTVLSRGMAETHRQQFTPFMPFGLEGLVATVGLVFVSYAGLTKVASVAEEVRDPERNIPLGMILSLATATLVYVVGVYIMVAVLDPIELRDDLTPVATAGEIFLEWLPAGIGLMLVVGAAVAAFASTGNAGILSASRYPLAMARDRLAPGRFAHIGRLGTPTPAVIATAATMIVFILLLDVESVAKLASSFQLLVFALLNLAVIVMRESRIESYDPGYLSPLYPWMQIAGFLIPFWLIAEMGALSLLFTLGMVGLGMVWYFYYGRARVVRGGAIFHVFERLGRRRTDELDRELRGILKEKGLRSEDPFDEVVLTAGIVDLGDKTSYEQIVREVSDHLARRLPIAAERLSELFLQETRLGITPVARGVALPHLRFAELETPRLVLVRVRPGVRVRTREEQRARKRVYALFFLVSPDDDPGQHLRILAQIAGRVDDEDFLRDWLRARDEQQLKETLLHHTNYLSLRLRRGSASESLIGRALRDVELPGDTLVALIRRERHVIVPRGGTVLEEDDRLTVIGEPAAIRRIASQYGG